MSVKKSAKKKKKASKNKAKKPRSSSASDDDDAGISASLAKKVKKAVDDSLVDSALDRGDKDDWAKQFGDLTTNVVLDAALGKQGIGQGISGVRTSKAKKVRAVVDHLE